LSPSTAFFSKNVYGPAIQFAFRRAKGFLVFFLTQYEIFGIILERILDIHIIRLYRNGGSSWSVGQKSSESTVSVNDIVTDFITASEAAKLKSQLLIGTVARFKI